MISDQNQAKDKIVPALIKAMAKIEKAKIDGKNPHRNSKYATLGSVFDACRDALLEQEIVISQTPFSSFEDKTVSVMTRLIHASGQMLTAGEDLKIHVPDMNAQAVGGAITYLRRYTLTALLGIVGDDEDDDGHRATFGNRQQKQSGNADRRQQPSESRQNAPKNETQGEIKADVKTPQESKSGGGSKDVMTDFWKQVGALKFDRERALEMVQDYRKGDHGEVGSEEAYQSLMASLEAAAREKGRDHLRIAS